MYFGKIIYKSLKNDTKQHPQEMKMWINKAHRINFCDQIPFMAKRSVSLEMKLLHTWSILSSALILSDVTEAKFHISIYKITLPNITLPSLSYAHRLTQKESVSFHICCLYFLLIFLFCCGRDRSSCHRLWKEVPLTYCRFGLVPIVLTLNNQASLCCLRAQTDHKQRASGD